MFGTLRYSALEDDTEFVGRSYDPLMGPKDGIRYVACDRCRSKKLRCSGQNGGCDRCKRCSSVCVYSLDAKAKHARRRKNAKGSNNSSGNSPRGEASSDVQPTTEKGKDSTPKAREQEKPLSPAIEQVRHNGNVMQDMTDMFTPGNSPDGSLIDDFIFTDEGIHGFFPDSRGQNVYEYLNVSNVPGQTNSEGIFPNRVFDLDQIDSMSTGPAPSDVSMMNAPTGPTLNAEDFEFPNLGEFQQRRQTKKDSETPKAIKSFETPHIQCQCLETVGKLFEKLDGKSHTEDLATLDSLLATQKKVLGRCGSVLNCATCVARPEYILFLGLITENLTRLCELTVSKYLGEVRSRYGDALSGHGEQRVTNGGKVFLGKYEIDSAEEWSSLIRVLIGMQLRNLLTLLQRIASSPGTGWGAGASRKAKMQATEERVATLVKRLRQPCLRQG